LKEWKKKRKELEEKSEFSKLIVAAMTMLYAFDYWPNNNTGETTFYPDLNK
jgi:hypothetical protein